MTLRDLLDTKAPCPPAALQIGSDAVRAIRLEQDPDGSLRLAGFSRRGLPAGAVKPSLEEPNLADADAVAAAAREALEEVGYKGRPIALLLPDTVCRAVIMDLEALPRSAAELAEVVRLRLKKVLPFPAEEARLSHATLPPTGRGPRLLAVAARATVLAPYEECLARLGLAVGIIDIAILGLAHLADRLAATSGTADDVMVVNVDEGALSVAILGGGDLLFLRTKALGEGGAAAESLAREVRLCQLYHQDRLQGGPLQAVYLRETGHDPRLAAEISAAANAAVKPIHVSTVVVPAAELDATVPFEAAALVGLLASRLERHSRGGADTTMAIEAVPASGVSA